MTMRRIFAIMLVLVALLTTILGACAEANKYSRFNNPGKGHDWEWVDEDPYFNENDNGNFHHNYHGYLNHLGETPR